MYCDFAPLEIFSKWNPVSPIPISILRNKDQWLSDTYSIALVFISNFLLFQILLLLCVCAWLLLFLIRDGHHKLIRWDIVTHGGIDGYSKLFVYHCSNNNSRYSLWTLYWLSGSMASILSPIRSWLQCICLNARGTTKTVWLWVVGSQSADWVSLVWHSLLCHQCLL